MKAHGAIDGVDEDRDSYVISEEHYIDSTGREVTDPLPTQVCRPTHGRSHVLFLGYGLRTGSCE